MNYLSVEGLSYRWGEQVLFADVNFGISEGQKVALVARNGAGKTTLLSMLAGKMPADSGKITWNDDIRVGWLEQEPEMNPENTVLQQIFAADNDTARIVSQYEAALVRGDEAALPKIVEKMDELKAWDYENRAKQMLSRLYIDDFDKKVGKLSGGQRKRVAIAALLLSEPDFLILDEPTNHLDVEIIEWLEEYLSRSAATVLMVTHDRYLLDRVCIQIIELDNKTIYTYQGNYGYYLQKRQERLDQKQTEVDKARNLLRKEQEWMNRQPQARGTKAQYRIDAFGDLQERAKKIRDERSFNLEFDSARLGRKVVDAYDLSKSYGERVLIKDFSYKFAKGERVAIVGANGAGKTTLLNLLTGSTEPDSGRIETGDTVVTGYYRQGGIQVREDQTVIEVIEDIADQVEAGGGHKIAAAQFLRKFLFPNEMHHVRVESLSGGERKRLYLLTVLVRQPNFLILDEPTYDLDILSLNVLEDYLTTFGGTVIVVSHDRFFVDKIAEHLFVLDGKGGVKDFPGNYSEYLAWKKAEERERQSEAAARRANEQKEKPAQRSSSQSRPVKMTYAQKKEFEAIEKALPVLNERKEAIEKELSEGKATAERIREISEEYEKVKNEIDEKEMRWLELSEIGQ